MQALTQILPLALVTWLALTVLIGTALGLLYHWTRRWLCSLPPRWRAALSLLTSLLPMGLALVWTILVFVPAMGAGWMDVHCHLGDGCGAHAPSLTQTGLGHGPALAGLLGLLWIAWRARRRWVDMHARGRVLGSLAYPTTEGYWVIESDRPVALTLGWFCPQMLISRGLIAATTSQERAAILAHEQAHRRRRDNLRTLLAACGSLFYPRAVRERLLTDLKAAAEQVCDAHAARAVGDPLIVARTLIKVTRLMSAAPMHPGCGFGDSDTVTRVHALLSPAPEPRHGALWDVLGIGLGGLLALTGLWAGLAPLHHLIEFMLFTP